MREIMNVKTGDDVLGAEISDESLEAAAYVGSLGAYTEGAWCTHMACPA